MNRTITGGDYNYRGYLGYGDTDRSMSHFQRRTLENLIMDRIDNPQEIQRRLSEMESYNYIDAEEMIENLKYAAMR